MQKEDLSLLGFTAPVFADFDNDAAIDKAYYDTKNNGIALYFNVRGTRSPSDNDLCRSIPTIVDGSPAGYFEDYDIFTSEYSLTTKGL